jgi:hypothetical protein
MSGRQKPYGRRRPPTNGARRPSSSLNMSTTATSRWTAVDLLGIPSCRSACGQPVRNISFTQKTARLYVRGRPLGGVLRGIKIPPRHQPRRLQRRRRRDDFIGDRLAKRRREHKRSHEQPRDTVGSATRMTRATCLGVQVAFRGSAKSASRRFSYEEASS